MPKPKKAPSPGPTVEPVSFEHGQKAYTIEGGLNAHGRFIRLIEVVGGRRNSIFIDLAAHPKMREFLDLIATRLQELPEVLPPSAGS